MALPQKVIGSAVGGSLPAGVVGEFSDDSQKSARAFLTFGKDSTPGEFGKFFKITDKALVSDSSDKTTVAEQGVAENVLLGILVNPKEHYVVGFTNSTKLPKDGISATIAWRGHIHVITKVSTTAGAPVYVDSDGEFATTGTLVTGAKWLKTVTVGSNEKKISEIAIDNPTIVPVAETTDGE